MDLLSRVINKILNQNPSLKQGVTDAQIIEAWALAVGETIAKHTRAVHIKNKTLTVEVDHPIWKQELVANKTLALQKLNRKISEIFNETANPEYQWVEDLFLGNLNQSKQKPRFPRPKSK